MASLYIIAGPNGAGKSTLYESRIRPKTSAPFLNADRLQKDELNDSSMDASYEAARIIRERQAEYIEAGRSFVTETVFSHTSKLDLITTAQNAGFRVVLFHVGVRHADISVKRVNLRVEKGGHPVPEDKIRARFERNQPLLRKAVTLADKAFVYDNSVYGRQPKLGLSFEKGEITMIADKLPKWMRTFYHNELDPFLHIQQNPVAASHKALNEIAKRSKS